MSTTPTLFVKGGESRFAYSAADEVALKFKGFLPQAEASEDTSYADLREQAKQLGIPAKGTQAVLAEAVAQALVAANRQTTIDGALEDLESEGGSTEPSALDQVTIDTEASA